MQSILYQKCVQILLSKVKHDIQYGGSRQVLWTVCAHRRMWSVTNYFLLNLTLSDILMATLNTTFSFIYMRDRLMIIFVISKNQPCHVTPRPEMYLNEPSRVQLRPF